MNCALRKTGIFAIAVLLAAMICSVEATAGSALYTTLGPGGAYDNSGGYSVDGSNYFNQVIANPFTLGAGGFVSDAVLALANVQGGNNPLNVYIESNSGGVPGSIIAQLTQVGTISGAGGLVTFTCSGLACGLGPGSYWLVAVEPDPNTQQGWFLSYGDQLGTVAYNEAGSPTGPWSTADGIPLNGFQLDTPEPATWLVLIPGLLGVGYGLRRRLLS